MVVGIKAGIATETIGIISVGVKAGIATAEEIRRIGLIIKVFGRFKVKVVFFFSKS
jgi:hypothetical protein